MRHIHTIVSHYKVVNKKIFKNINTNCLLFFSVLMDSKIITEE